VRILALSRTRKRGVRVVTNVERGMRWTRAVPRDERYRRGRRRRVVLAPLGWCQVWRAMTCRVTVTKKSWTPGRARTKPLKPFAQGGPACSGRTCGDYARVVLSFPREATGAASIRLSLRPLFSRDTDPVSLGRIARAGIAETCRLFEKRIGKPANVIALRESDDPPPREARTSIGVVTCWLRHLVRRRRCAPCWSCREPRAGRRPR